MLIPYTNSRKIPKAHSNAQAMFKTMKDDEKKIKSTKRYILN